MNSSTTKWCVLVALVAICVTAGLRGAAADLPEMDGVPTAEAETVGMSSERLDRIDGVMQGYIDRNETAGVVTLVAPTKPVRSGSKMSGACRMERP